jgi:preprotein translocase subunit SecA
MNNMRIWEKIFGTYSQRELKRVVPIVDKIDKLDPMMEKLTNEELKNKTNEFKERLSKG